MSVVVVIPARNEADRIAATVEAAASIPEVGRVVVVDDGSSDGTAENASDAGAEVIRVGANAGKGAALERGVAAVGPDEVVLLLDADLAESAAEASALLEPVLAGTADMTVATLATSGRKAGFGLVKGLARRGIALLGDRSFRPEAPLSGQRALNPVALLAARPFERGYGVEVTTTVRVLRWGLRIQEVGTSMSHRETGRDAAGFVHRGRQLADVAEALLRLSFEPRPTQRILG